MRNEHLKTLQDMIVTEQVSGSHDNGDDSGSEVEEVVTLFGEFSVMCVGVCITHVCVSVHM